MDIRVEQCVICGKGFEGNPTLDHFADHMMWPIEQRCEEFRELEDILDKIGQTLADADLEVVVDVVKSLIQDVDDVRAVLVAGNAILHFDKRYNGLGLTPPSYLLPSPVVWPAGSEMTYAEFDVFVLRYKALLVVSSLEDRFRNLEYWDRIEAEGDSVQEIYEARETKLCVVLKSIAMSDKFWDKVVTIVGTVEPVLGLISDLTCMSSTVFTIYVSAKKVKKQVDLIDDLTDDFVAMVHRKMRRFGTPLHRVAGFLNPMYMTENALWSGNVIDNGMRCFFCDIVDDADWEKFLEELGTYLTDGPTLAGTVTGHRHPAVWWHEHGPGMSTLARYALAIVSYPHSMNFVEDELPIERFVTTQRCILRPYEGEFNANSGYNGSFEEFLDMIEKIDHHAELLPQFEEFY